MQFNSETPRAEATISEHNFTVPQPFTEGHTCTANEAQALNQLLIENVRNNFAQQMKRAGEKGEAIPGQAELDAYVSEYQFGIRRSFTSDPVRKEAIDIAINLVKQAINEQGKKVKDFDASIIREKAEEVVDANPELLEQAKAIIAQRSAVGKSVLAGISL